MTTLRELSQYRFEGRSEQAVREEWIRPLLVHLGYGITTLNEVRYEQRLALAKPFRRIGRRRVDVDYVPTVLGHGLWIIEAKAHRTEEWDDAISQAWLYATHPEIDVPFIAIADGGRIAVYDTHKPDWDSPVVDISTPVLEADFAQLAQVLGAANVTRAVQRRRMQHLGLAMQAELNPGRLEEYVADVKQLATDARPSVQANVRAVRSDQFAMEQRRQRELIDAGGLFGVGIMANQLFGGTGVFCQQAVERLLQVSPDGRQAEFERLREAARYRRSETDAGEVRMLWTLRYVELFIALSARNEPGCEAFEGFARQAIRAYILNFPEDELARAARRLERILPVFTARWLRSNEQIDFRRLARDMQQHWSDETRLRARVDADRVLIEFVDRHVLAVWRTVTWEAASLNELAASLETALPTMTSETDGVIGPAHDPDFNWQYEEDMLRMATLYELGSLITPELLDGEVVAELRRLAAEHTDQLRIVTPASKVIAAYDADATAQQATS